MESTGTYTDLDYKTMLKSQCTLAILPSDILPKTDDELDAKTEELRNAAQRFALLEIPFIVDRSSDEENDPKIEAEKALKKVQKIHLRTPQNIILKAEITEYKE